MASLLKVTVAWSGFVGSPGYSNFYFHEVNPGASWDAGAVAAGDKVNTFFNAIKGLFPPSVRWRVQTDVPLIEETNGELVDIANGGPRTDIAGSAVLNPYSAATGAVITWRTSGVRNGRRVRGRTFLVPGSMGMVDNDGTLNASAATTLQTAANALIAPSPDRALQVWARPTAPGATDGIGHNVLSATIPDKVAVLKSRRD